MPYGRSRPHSQHWGSSWWRISSGSLSASPRYQSILSMCEPAWNRKQSWVGQHGKYCPCRQRKQGWGKHPLSWWSCGHIGMVHQWVYRMSVRMEPHIALRNLRKQGYVQRSPLWKGQRVETLVIERHRPPYNRQKNSTIIKLGRESMRQKICGQEGGGLLEQPSTQPRPQWISGRGWWMYWKGGDNCQAFEWQIHMQNLLASCAHNSCPLMVVYHAEQMGGGSGERGLAWAHEMRMRMGRTYLE